MDWLGRGQEAGLHLRLSPVSAEQGVRPGVGSGLQALLRAGEASRGRLLRVLLPELHSAADQSPQTGELPAGVPRGAAEHQETLQRRGELHQDVGRVPHEEGLGALHCVPASAHAEAPPFVLAEDLQSGRGQLGLGSEQAEEQEPEKQKEKTEEERVGKRATRVEGTREEIIIRVKDSIVDAVTRDST